MVHAIEDRDNREPKSFIFCSELEMFAIGPGVGYGQQFSDGSDRNYRFISLEIKIYTH